MKDTPPAASGATAIDGLRIDYLHEALGIGNASPRLSWTVQAGNHDWHQASYQLHCRLASGEVKSGPVVERPQSTFVPWPFEALRSRQRVEVWVTVWDSRGAEVVSRPHAVEAGLLHADDWQARFVAPAWDEDPTTEHPAPLMRKSFEIRAGLVKARLYTTALGLYEAALNGQPVSDEVFAPGWTSYRHRVCYQTSDVTHLLATGCNVLAARIGDGWFRGRIGFLGGKRNTYGDKAAFLAQLELEYADGSTERILSGPSQGWVCGTGGLRASSLYDGETYDARLEPAGWMSKDFDASGWSDVLAVDWDMKTLAAPMGPPVRRTGEVEAQAITRSPSGKLLVDFGQNLVGWLRIRVSGRRGRTLTFRHAEILEHGELCTRPLRFAKATDRYVLDGDGVEIWEPRFTFHGFRYVEVEGWPGELQLSDIHAVVVHSDMVRSGWFECSDPEVNRLHENVVWGMRGNFLSIPTDCPQRDERLGWTGDIQVFAPTASYLYDVNGFLSSWLQDLAAEQADKGLVPVIVPDMIPVRTSCAGWGDAATVVPWVLYERSGDTGVLRRQYASMKGWVDQVLERVDEQGLWEWGLQLGDWLDPKAPPGDGSTGRTDKYVVASAYLVRSLRIVADTAGLLDEADDHQRYLDIWQRTRLAFRRRFITPDGRVMSDSPAAYAMALSFGLLDDDEKVAAGARLNWLVEQDDYRIGTGFLGTPLVCDALVDTGHVDTAYRLLLQTQPPSWLYAVRMGATTIWERWDSMLLDGTVNPEEMTSFNHYAFGAVADWLHRCVAGLESAAPGFSKLRVRPRPGEGITWASTRHLTPLGEASVRWALEDGLFKLSIHVPANATADVHVPGQSPVQVGSGFHEWAVPWVAPLTRAHGVDTALPKLREQAATWTRLGEAVRQIDPTVAALMDSPALAVIRAKTLRDVLSLSRHYRALVAAATATLNGDRP